jgi:CRP/FNR family transcriptional regulator, nitrogen fixation regulation protein
MGQKSHINGTSGYRENLDAPHLLQVFEVAARKRHYRRGEEICSGACASDLWYRVVSGAVKRCVTLPNGRQQIVDLLLPGDMFACSLDNDSDVSIEAAAEETELACYPRRAVDLIANSDARLARLQGEIAIEMVCRLQAQLLILGRTTALKKIGAFLLELAKRQTGEPADGIVLPVSRYDIADYLAMSVETVSRSLTGLKERGLISFKSTRSIKIINREALEDSSDSAETIQMHRVSTVVPFGRKTCHDGKADGLCQSWRA